MISDELNIKICSCKLICISSGFLVNPLYIISCLCITTVQVQLPTRVLLDNGKII
uniref:Uncharacterized protein n=1 Tax=Anguilla anguilla TaxID=7936 RepID=A0A0E9S1M5_ANGAN